MKRKNTVEIEEIETEETSKANRINLLLSVAMLNQKEVAEAIGTTYNRVQQLRQCGLLRAIKMGKGYFYPQSEILRFQTEMLGKDLSNLDHIEQVVEGLRA